MKAKKTGTVRIIAGQWRGRRLAVPDLPGLRPSGDRSRETLFNWLQPVLRGARCVDLFAGSGALGLEAASRGAACVTLVENSRAAAQALRASVVELGADHVEVFEAEAIAWLRGQPPASIDIVFVDPPFGSGLAEQALAALAAGGCLAPGALVYLETDLQGPTAGAAWETHREKRIGDVRMQLLKRS